MHTHATGPRNEMGGGVSWAGPLLSPSINMHRMAALVPASAPRFPLQQQQMVAAAAAQSSTLAAAGGANAPPPPSALRPPNNQISAHALVQEARMRKHRHNECYTIIQERCYARIRRCAGVGIASCWFDVPEVIVGRAPYDLTWCVRLLMHSLEQNAFQVQYFFPRTLHISWERAATKGSSYGAAGSRPFHNNSREARDAAFQPALFRARADPHPVPPRFITDALRSHSSTVHAPPPHTQFIVNPDPSQQTLNANRSMIASPDADILAAHEQLMRSRQLEYPERQPQQQQQKQVLPKHKKDNGHRHGNVQGQVTVTDMGGAGRGGAQYTGGYNPPNGQFIESTFDSGMTNLLPVDPVTASTIQPPVVVDFLPPPRPHDAHDARAMQYRSPTDRLLLQERFRQQQDRYVVQSSTPAQQQQQQQHPSIPPPPPGGRRRGGGGGGGGRGRGGGGGGASAGQEPFGVKTNGKFAMTM